MRILIAEDDSVSRHLLKANLARWGHEVVACADGDETWKMVRNPDAPRLAVLDWMMPGLDGIEICRKLRQLPHGKLAYLIMLTAKGRKEDIVAGLDAGANDYIVKPFVPEELNARIRVGARVMELQDQLIQAERDRVLIQAAGAAAHAINQPLTVLLGTAQLLAMQIAPGDPRWSYVEDMQKAGRQISDIVKKMRQARRYATRPYIEGIEIVDLDAASGKSPEDSGSGSSGEGA